MTKPVTEFNFKNRAAGVRHSYCRECGKKLTRSHYKRNKRAYLDRNTRARLRHRALIRGVKSRPCADCGVQYPYYVMDFDHRDGETKIFGLHAVNRMTLAGILREIGKCDVVCANCHRERTHQRMLEATGRAEDLSTAGRPGSLRTFTSNRVRSGPCRAR